MKRSHIVSLAGAVMVALVAFGAVFAAGWSPKLGLDLAGGEEVVYRPAHAVPGNYMTESVNIITSRIDGLGISGASVGTQGGDIVAALPGVKNPQQVINTIGETAQLYFRPALCEAPPYTKPTAVKGKAASSSPGPLPTTCPSADQLSAKNLGAKASTSSSSGISENPVPADSALASYPSTPVSQDKPSSYVLLPTSSSSGQPGVRYLLGPAQVTGKALSGASASFVPGTGWVVNYSLNSTGAVAWDKLAQAQFHAIVAIDMDSQVVSAPIIQPSQAAFTSFGGSGQISGNFTHTSAQSLALVLQYGSLPVPLHRISTVTVSATLGHSSLKAGLLAGLAGLLLVLLYMIFYYRILGVVVLAGLAVTAALLWAIVSIFSHLSGLTLDLAGVTGLIVSVGITVDSYVVYFERLKDEARSGRSIRTGVEKGFQGAFRTVLAADLVSLLAAVLLWFLAIGTVKGFAFFLGLSTLLDIFTTYFFTRPLVIMLGRNSTVTEARVIGISSGLAVETQA
ncbi:MAG: protein translocase subunit SecD [Acidimicrobiales bacterium]